jgi:hypothetical protein
MHILMDPGYCHHVSIVHIAMQSLYFLGERARSGLFFDRKV